MSRYEIHKRRYSKAEDMPPVFRGIIKDEMKNGPREITEIFNKCVLRRQFLSKRSAYAPGGALRMHADAKTFAKECKKLGLKLIRVSRPVIGFGLNPFCMEDLVWKYSSYNSWIKNRGSDLYLV